MRHRKKGRKLGRTASHRKALLRNLANQVIELKEIRTTTAKAKEARSVIEKLITYAKKGDLHHRRLAFSFLRKKDSIKILFDEIAPVFETRNGGYTRIIKLGRRNGDGAHLSILQLVGFEKLAEAAKPDKKGKAKEKTEDKAKDKTKKTAADKKQQEVSGKGKKKEKPVEAGQEMEEVQSVEKDRKKSKSKKKKKN
jgi:large subunit ribosomal protein L17